MKNAPKAAIENGLTAQLTNRVTLVLLFGFQGEQIIAQPLIILMLAVRF